METQHTKTPWKLELVPTSAGSCWKIGPFPSRGARDVTCACVYMDGVRLDEARRGAGAELSADARLMAAAPEMLIALNDLLFASENADETSYVTDTGFLDLEAIQEKARAAIAKATGTTEGN